MNKRLIEVVKRALHEDNSIAVAKDSLATCEGFSEEYLAQLGLSRNDLKKLERAGLAIRGYTKNFFLPGETLHNGEVVQQNKRFHGRGQQVRWLLIGDGQEGESE